MERKPVRSFVLCAEHGTNLASESLATGIYCASIVNHKVVSVMVWMEEMV